MEHEIVIVIVIVIVIGLFFVGFELWSAFGGMCPKCGKPHALERTGKSRGGKEGWLARTLTEREWRCKYCDHREWRVDSGGTHHWL